MSAIGEYRTERLTCDDTHVPGCYNSNLGLTACRCGAAWWVGNVGVWISTPVYAPDKPAPSLGVGIGAPGLRPEVTEFYGWDTYYLHAPSCTRTDHMTPCAPCCTDATPTDYHTAYKASREGS